MNVIQDGINYFIYGDNMVTKKKLPAQCYNVEFMQNRGFYLREHDPLVVTETMYGPLIREDKAGKVVRAFHQMNRSLGVLLSGMKGSGKSLFSKLICQKMMEEGIPVIIVDHYIEGMNDFIESIDQDLVVFFDEFDKVFGGINPRDGKEDPSTEWLSTFDGTSLKKRLFIVTCNYLDNISSYLVNRPGRFHYHFRFSVPEEQETIEYMQANLQPEYHSQIEEIVGFSRGVDLTYDCLRAICFEINNGEEFKSAIKDLNIINVDEVSYRAELTLADGKKLVRRKVSLDIYDYEETCVIHFYNTRGNYACSAVFDGTTGQSDFMNGGISYDPAHLQVRWDDDDDVEKEFPNKEVQSLILNRARDRDLHY